jgi:prolyl-tRNA synthetase
MMGRKSDAEKFAGGKATYAVEPLMPDGKALQGATSHNLGQNFSKVFEIQFQNKEGKMEYGWQTSWGLSTRSLGGMFLVHGDDNGVILPPKVAPIQVVIMPIIKSDADAGALFDYAKGISDTLQKMNIRSKVDMRLEPSIGRRFNEWEVKGVPVRFEVGPKEFEQKGITIARRDTGEKTLVKLTDIASQTQKILDDIQRNLFHKAKKFLDANIHDASSFEEFKNIMKTDRGFIRAFWCEDASCEAEIKGETKATTRCLPLDAKEEKGKCILCGKPAIHRWIFAQAY